MKYFFKILYLYLSASLRSELNHQHAAAIDQLRHNHHQEVAAAKMELERSIELSRHQVHILYALKIINIFKTIAQVFDL